MDITALRSDPEFVALPFTEKVKAMAMLDPEFRALAPVEQHRGLALIFPPSAREGVSERQMFPPVASQGDPNADPNAGSLMDYVKAGGRGLAHLAGVPTTLDEARGSAKSLLLNALTAGTYGPMHAALNAGADVAQGRVPVLDKPVRDVMAPAIAYGVEGRPPTRDENLNATTGGTELATMAALQHPVVQSAITRVMPAAGSALERSGNTQYADALAARGSELRPLGESIGSQLAAKGRVLTNPAEQLGTEFGGHGTLSFEETVLPKFKNAVAQSKQLDALHAKYPDAEIVSKPDEFIVRQAKDTRGRGSLDQQAADALAEQAPKAEPVLHPIRSLARAALGSTLGGLVGATGGPAGIVAGAKVGAEVMGGVEAAAAVRNMIRSPLWKTMAGSLKAQVGKAMQSGDFTAVAQVASRVLGGENLEDDYGHDQALHNLIQTITAQSPEAANDPKQLHQLLQDYDAVYVDPSGTAVQVPYHVQRQTINAITGQ